MEKEFPGIGVFPQGKDCFDALICGWVSAVFCFDLSQTRKPAFGMDSGHEFHARLCRKHSTR
jgi:hypothetical protein